MNRFGCPVCGYDEFEALDKFGCTTFEICDSCGNESGCDYDQSSQESHLAKIRDEWITSNNCQWWGDRNDMPIDWNPYQQMEKAGIQIKQKRS